MGLKSYARVLTALAIIVAAAAKPSRPFNVVLARLARVAELYRDSALGFSCLETIVSTGMQSHRIQLAYIFVNEHGKLRDYRTWPGGTTAKAQGDEVDPLSYKIPRYLASAYLWAFVFRADRQPRYRFKLVGEDSVLQRAALKIQFVPVPPIAKDINDWAGYAWVDRDTSQILKFESYAPPDWDRHVQLVADTAAASKRDAHENPEPYVIDRIVTEFGFVRNGMRFPSHVVMTTIEYRLLYGHHDDPLRERTLDKVVQDYDTFEFFSVRTSDEITSYVDGNGRLTAPR